MSPQHTTAPWRVIRLGRRIRIVGADGTTVGNLVESDRDHDARLIAAAPEMLEALRFCAAKLEENGIGYDAFAKASAAIAKATTRGAS